ncbi:hypothetical protein [Methanobrevibacter oralis]|uniref:Electron transport complex subunit RsxB n=1 Tax=Methanobrevibacter oralis TaxID=66851 RepID=A0A166BR15_METOA|nr:hypothetical protein [Methanobrevibacter oralis]KZX13704.1 electron transport complex subunit RsxB [Methanobrevibacter oralis]
MRARHRNGGSPSLLGLFIEHAAKQAINTAIENNKRNANTDIVFRIRTRFCDGLRCQKCVLACPNNVLTFNGGKIAIRDIKDCSFCGICEVACPKNCITVKKKV